MINATLKNANILIVDDQQNNIDVLTGLMDDEGYVNYTATTDSRKVIALYEQFKPDLILLDLQMPHLTGFQVMAQLKTIIPIDTYLPILVLTADVTQESKQKALSGGASDFLIKPFDLIEVELRIRNLLKARFLHQQLGNQNQILEGKVKERTAELEKINVELLFAMEKAEEMNKLKSIFLANMSHELRTPLISVLGFAELLKLDITEDDQIELLDQILEGGKRLNITLNGLLEWAKLESEKSSLKLSPCNLAAEIQKSIDLNLPMAKSKKIFISSEFGDTKLIANIDADLFGKAFFQLLHNAIKFTANGGIFVALNQIKKDKIDWAVIQVIDTGIGIAKENFEKIFIEFRQSSEGLSRNHEGTGLGLSIANKIVGLMNGKIEIESEVGKGSTFSIWLPAVLDTKALNIKVEEKRKTIESEPAIRKTGVFPTGLLVEDNPSNRMLIKRMLAQNYLVEEAEDGYTAIALASQKLVDFVLMDINLGPGPDGIETMHEIKKISGYFNVPIIAVTANAMYGDKEMLIKEGFDDYIKKPFTKEELITLLKNVFML